MKNKEGLLEILFVSVVITISSFGGIYWLYINQIHDTLVYKDCIDACNENTGLICLAIADKLPDICSKKSQKCIKKFGSVERCDAAFKLRQE